MVVTEVPTLGLSWDTLGEEPYEAPGVAWSYRKHSVPVAIFRNITEDKFPIHEKSLHTPTPPCLGSSSQHGTQQIALLTVVLSPWMLC